MSTKDRDWTWEPTGTDNAVVYIGYSTIGGVYKGGDEDTLSHSDARLIAAAPELLEALENIIEHEHSCSCAGECDGKCWHSIARRAIAKATGGES